jgi:hypothetical protein
MIMAYRGRDSEPEKCITRRQESEKRGIQATNIIHKDSVMPFQPTDYRQVTKVKAVPLSLNMSF